MRPPSPPPSPYFRLLHQCPQFFTRIPPHSSVRTYLHSRSLRLTGLPQALEAMLALTAHQTRAGGATVQGTYCTLLLMSPDFPSGLWTGKHPSRSRVWTCNFAREVPGRLAVSRGLHWLWLVLALLGPGVAHGPSDGFPSKWLCFGPE